MALNRQSQKDVQDTATYIEDTLKSVSANLGEVFKQAVESAFDGVDATVMTVATKDFTRAMAAAAKTSEDLVKNHYRISQGLTTSKNLEKQLQTIAERKLEIERRYAYTKQLAEDIGKRMTKQQEKAFGDAQAALDLQERILEGDKQSLIDIEKRIGLTGKLISSISKIPGIGQFIKADEIDQAMRKAALDENATKFTTMGVAAKMVGKQLYEGLTDPLFIVGKIFDAYLDINKASVDLQRLTGQNAVAAASWNTSYASAKDILETMAELTKQTGRNAQNIFSSKVIGQAAELKTTMGLTAEEAGGIAIMAQTSGKAVGDITESVVATTSAFNGANRSAVSQGQVLRDVANTADSIKLSLGNNDVAIAKAASAARRLGMDLARVDQIAGSLMNFEDSIGKELEAELLTGKQLNLEKARELALNNDLAGLSEELFKNSSDIAEFGKMNRIQQESYAAALGMSRDELAKIAYQKGLDLKMTDEQAAKAAGVNAEDMKRVTAQENFAKALEKIAGAVAPILDLVGDILSMPLVPYLILGAAAVSKIGGGLVGTVKSMGSLAKGALDFAKNLNMKGIGEFFSGLKGKLGDLKGAFGEGFAGKIQEKVAGGATDTLADKAKDKLSDKAEGAADGLIDKGLDKVAGGAEQAGDKIAGTQDKLKNVKAGTGVKDFLTNLGKGLASLGKSLANGQVILGLAVLTGAIIGIGFALKLAAPGIEAFGKVISAAFSGVAELVGAVADGFVKIIGAVSMENIGPMLLLGPALFGIAAGLSAVAFAGLAAIPAIGGLVLLASVAPKLASIGIGGENKSAEKAKGKEKEGSMAALEAKFDTLIELVKQGTTINLDGTKISTSVNRNLPKVQVAGS